ncbi:hypothetical protein J0X19_15245 [Hymenobacter sp. BT186]|uniref:Uncharacterized protein n=1 Tax=Hymenobacter telluris TaxID=2816474 RepID=A0A939EZ80_9BACT|nr:hypothetical protein [Hymenobacter telluris]MBO0359317.1 hypothetical protein [Hymenobacter telluris]MBW3375343.1 hypothetical protein [Hymenobacter norwichensis]
MLTSSTSIQSTITRTLLLWLLSNIGGTFLLGVGFALTHHLNDSTIAIAAGLLAALITLPLVPLALPFFALVARFCPACSRRSVALLGVTLFFLAANELLHLLLPFATFWGLLEMSVPYLAAGLLTVFWLYSSGGKTSTAALFPKKQDNRLLLS